MQALLANHQDTLSRVSPKVEALDKTVETHTTELADHSDRIKALEAKMARAEDVEKETRATLADQAEALDRLKQLLRKMSGDGGLSADVETRLTAVEVEILLQITYFESSIFQKYLFVEASVGRCGPAEGGLG